MIVCGKQKANRNRNKQTAGEERWRRLQGVVQQSDFLRKEKAEWSERTLNSPKITSYLLLLNIFSSSQWETLQGQGKVLRRIFKDLKTRRNYSDRRWTTKCASHSVFFNLYVITTHNYIKNHGSKQSYS